MTPAIRPWPTPSTWPCCCGNNSWGWHRRCVFVRGWRGPWGWRERARALRPLRQSTEHPRAISAVATQRDRNWQRTYDCLSRVTSKKTDDALQPAHRGASSHPAQRGISAMLRLRGFLKEPILYIGDPSPPSSMTELQHCAWRIRRVPHPDPAALPGHFHAGSPVAPAAATPLPALSEP
jgi:hypothetical protein